MKSVPNRSMMNGVIGLAVTSPLATKSSQNALLPCSILISVLGVMFVGSNEKLTKYDIAI